ESGAVIDALKRIHAEKDAYREIVPGRPYVPPPQQNKLDPRTAAFEEFEGAMRHVGADTTVERALQRAVMGIGPFGAREIAARAGVDPGAPKGELGEDGAASLWKAIQELVRAIDAGASRPSSFIVDGRADFWCFPSVNRTGDAVPHASVQQLLDRHYQAVEEQEAFKALAQRIEAALRQNRAR